MAIKNQVTEYMLKPTDIDEFEQLFRKIRKNLDEEKSRREWLFNRSGSTLDMRASVS